MRKALKGSLSLLLAITIIFGSVYTGLGEVVFSENFGVNAKAVSYVGVSGHTVVDRITFNGATTEAVYTDYYGDGYNSDTTYCCAAFVKRFYSNSYGINVWNLIYQKTPLTDNGSFSVTTSPKVGDIVRRNSKTHWMIVKAVSGSTVTFIEQNWWQTPYSQAPVNRTISTTDSDYTFFRYSGAVDGGSSIDFWSISHTDGTDAGIDKNSTFTISGKYKFWFKKYDSDTNYYINVFLDNTQLLDHASSDDNGYVSVEIDAATITPGLHTLTANLVNTSGTYSVSKQFYSEIKDNQAPVLSEVKVAAIAENGYSVTAKASDNVGVTKVMFPTWIPGQSTATWLQGTYNSSTGLWECWMPVSNWSNHYGTYYTHVYAYDAAGNETCYGMPDIRVPKVASASDALASSGTYDLSKTSTIYAAGWAYNKNGDAVKLYHRIDNGAWTEFTLAERSDVQNAYSDCKQLKCGYYKNISISNLSAGQHIVDIIVSTNGMSRVIASKTFTVVRPESFVYFDMNDGSSKNINLLAPQKATKTTGGITYSFDGATGIITLNGTASGNIDLFSKPFKVSSGEIYKITSTVVSGSVSNGCLVLEAYDNDGNRMNFDTVNTSKTGTWTITSTQAQKINRISCWAWCDTSKGNVSFNNYKIKFKLEKVASSSASATGFTPNAKYLAYGQTYDTMPAPTRTGYSFDGWYTAKSGGTKITASSVFGSGSAQTLYAHWTANKYTVTFNANGGTGAPSAQTKTYGTALALSSTIPTRTGYTFKNWNTKADGTGTSYSAGGSYTVNEATTLYAQWKINTYTVSYNANGGTGAPASQTKTYGQTLTLSKIKPIRAGYAFCGWATSSNATEATYSAGGSFNTDSNTALYAVWKKPILENENTEIDFNRLLIFTSISNSESIANILVGSEGATIVSKPSYVNGDIEFYGIGTIVSAFDGEDCIGEYTVIVEGDLNGDSVCDVLDASYAALVASGKKTATEEEIYAANGEVADIIDVEDYQSVVNKAVS